MSERPDWDQYFMDLAHKVATRSTCERADVGAVLVEGKRIVSTGYNGAPRGLPHCSEEGCLIKKVGDTEEELEDHCRRTVHAEQNAIIQAAQNAASTEGTTMYVTHQPCFMCAKMIINAGIERIVFDKEYDDVDATRFFKKAGIELVVLDR